MSDFNLEGFEPAKQGKTKGTGATRPSFELKYAGRDFTVSKGVFDKLGLAEYGLKVLVNKDKQVALEVVDNDSANIFKRTTKTGPNKFKTFRSPLVETPLVESGVISIEERVKGVAPKVTLFSLEKVENASGRQVYVIVPKGEGDTAPVGLSTGSAPEQPKQEAAIETGTAPAVDQIPSGEELLGLEQADETPQADEPATSAEDEDFTEKW